MGELAAFCHCCDFCPPARGGIAVILCLRCAGSNMVDLNGFLMIEPQGQDTKPVIDEITRKVAAALNGVAGRDG